MFSQLYLIAALTLPSIGGFQASPSENANESKYVGQVISIRENKLAITSKGDKDLSFTVSSQARIRLDDKICKLSDLKAGMRLRVITNNLDATTALRIQAIDKFEEFENTHDGTFVSITGAKLEMAALNKEIHTRTLVTNVKIACDGRECKAQDLKLGMRLRVTVDRGDKSMTTRIEAIDRNADFDKED